MKLSLRGLLHHFNNRISEVVTSTAMIGIGMQIIVAPEPTDYQSLYTLLHCVSGDFIAAFFIIIGAVRMSALIANGHWQRVGPWMRALGALVGGAVWLMMYMSLIGVSKEELTSLGAPTYLIFAFTELISIYRALAMRDHDGRHR